MGLNDAPMSGRPHIGVFGKRNSGKSSLVNAVTNQRTAIVSGVAGTTADPVYKAMEIRGIGACVIIDTAGFDDSGELGALRVEKTKQAAEKTDIAIVVFADESMERELEWIEYFKERHTPVAAVVNKADVLPDAEAIADAVQKRSGITPAIVSALTGEGVDALRASLPRLLPEGFGVGSITGGLAQEGDVVLLVMPQDSGAPKGRLLLPQAQTLRELLDKGCLPICATEGNAEAALASLKNPPQLIITDSTLFKRVYELKPPQSRLTSFSILFAANKGDVAYFLESASAIGGLTEQSRVLIAEACTHAPVSEDIGRVKIPAMLRKKAGSALRVDVVGGVDFPEDLTGYDLVIHCGACMFNRKYVLSRVELAKAQNVPMTNYGVVIAYLNGILDKIDIE